MANLNLLVKEEVKRMSDREIFSEMSLRAVLNCEPEAVEHWRIGRGYDSYPELVRDRLKSLIKILALGKKGGTNSQLKAVEVAKDITFQDPDEPGGKETNLYKYSKKLWKSGQNKQATA